MKNQEIQKIKISELKLWSENPRDPLGVDVNDDEIIYKAITENENKWNLQKLMNQLGDFYDFSELPIVVEVDGMNIVYDGNRRISLIKYLQNEKKFINRRAKLKHKGKQDFLDLKKIPCNVCSIEVALDNIERKHTNGGTWNELERGYFKHIHRKEKKSIFLSLEEATGIISKNPELNKRFVSEEILNKSNLEEIGFGFDTDNNIISNYNDEFVRSVFNEISDLVVKKEITTRKNRGELKKVLSSRNTEMGKQLIQYDQTANNKPIQDAYSTRIDSSKNNLPNNGDIPVKPSRGQNRTPITKKSDDIFGKKLILIDGPINDLYRAIEKIYDSNKNSDELLPIIAMSLRLILEVGARLYYDEIDPQQNKKDQLLKGFLDIAKKDMKIDSTDKNYLALTAEWMDAKINLEAILAKYAHGSIAYDRGTILNNSKIVGEIIEFYYKK